MTIVTFDQFFFLYMTVTSNRRISRVEQSKGACSSLLLGCFLSLKLGCCLVFIHWAIICPNLNWV